MVTEVVRKRIPEAKNNETDPLVQGTQVQTGVGILAQTEAGTPSSGSLDELFDAACEGYKKGLTKLLIHYGIVSKDDINAFLKNKKKISALFMTLDIVPSYIANDAAYAQISNVSDIPNDYLAYLLDMDELTIGNLQKKDKQELVQSLPESSITMDQRVALIYPSILALSADSAARPLLGAALYLAEQAGETFICFNANDSNWKKSLGATYIPTIYITEAAKKYGVSDEICLKALKAMSDAKKRFIKK